MRHLVFINGPWQAITAFASLREAGVFLQDVDLIMIDQNEDIAAYEVTRQLVEALSDRKPDAILGAIDRWQEIGPFAEFCLDYRQRCPRPTLWLNSFHRCYARHACEVFSKSSICLYEDGGRNYVDADTMAGLRVVRGRFCWPGDSGWRKRQLWLPQRLRRVQHGYLLLEDELGCPNYLMGKSVRVRDGAVKEILGKAGKVAPNGAVDREVVARKPFLLAGQNISRGGNIAWEEELSLYERAARLILDRGYYPVWKDHPRNEIPFHEALRERVGDLGLFPDSRLRAWPLELIADQFQFRGSASIMSSSLFYLKRFEGVPCYTIAHWVMERLQEPYRSQARLFHERALPLEELILVDKRK